MGLQEIKDDIFVEYTNESVSHFKYGSIKKYPECPGQYHGGDIVVVGVNVVDGDDGTLVGW